MQLAELELAGDLTRVARTQLGLVAEDARIKAPLRALTASVALGWPIARDLWLRAEETVSTEQQVELLCGLELAAGGAGLAATDGTQGLTRVVGRVSPFAEAAPRARIPRLRTLFASRAAQIGQQVVAGAEFIALHADYAARLEASRAARAQAFSPAPWSLIDWPLLAVHIAIQRAGRFPFLPFPFPHLDPMPIEHSAYELMSFLRDLAKELGASREPPNGGV